MNTKVKKILGILAAIVIIVAIISIAAINLKNGNHNDKTTKENQTTVLSNQTVTLGDEETSAEGKSENYWDNMDVVEDADKKETRKDKNGEVVTNKDGKPDDGWSPLVPAEDLE